MATRAEKQAYTRKLRDILAQFEDMEMAVVRDNIEFLQQIRRELRASLADSPSQWTQRIVDEQLRQIERLVIWYEARLTERVTQGVDNTAVMGSNFVVEPLQAAGAGGLVIGPTPPQINTLRQFSADLVRGISQDLNNQLSLQIRMAGLGQKTPFQTMKDVTRILGVEAGSNRVTRSIAYRAERVVRTDLGRAFNLSIHAQQLHTAGIVPGTEKSWMATADLRTRRTHLRAHRQQVPVDKPFKVGNSELMYPLDPSGEAKETVQCRCRSVTVHPDIGYIATPLDGRVAAMLKKGESDG